MSLPMFCARLWPRVDFSYQEIHGTCLYIWGGTAGKVNTDHVSCALCVFMPYVLNCCCVRVFQHLLKLNICRK